MESNFGCNCKSPRTIKMLYSEQSGLAHYFYCFHIIINLLAFLLSIYHCCLFFRNLLLKFHFLVGLRIQFLWDKLLTKTLMSVFVSKKPCLLSMLM